MGDDPHRLASAIQSNRRSRLIFGVLALLPLLYYAQVFRHTSHLLALAEHGQSTVATITGVRSGKDWTSTDVEYHVGNQRFEASLPRGSAPGDPGDEIPVLYLPDRPEWIRADAAATVAEATRSRRLGGRVALGAFGFLVLFAAMSHVQLRRLETRGVAELTDPVARKARYVLMAAVFFPLMAVIVGWHWADATGRGQSVVPVVLGAALSMAVVVGTGAYMLWNGQEGAAARGARLMAVLVPIGVLLGVVRLVVALLG